MVTIATLIIIICLIHAHGAFADEQHQLSASHEQEYIVTSVPMQSVVLPCQAISPHMESDSVMWYKLGNFHPAALNVGKRLITKDARLSVAYYSVDHGRSPAKWDLHIMDVRLSDAALYQCHVREKNTSKEIRTNVKLIVKDIIVDIEPIDVFVPIGESSKFQCNFTGQHRVRQEDIAWLKDNKQLIPDIMHVITSTEFPDSTVTILEIVVSNLNDSGTYRCSDGHGLQSREAKLYLRDANQQLYPRSLSSTASRLSFRTVFLFIVVSTFGFYTMTKF